MKLLKFMVSLLLTVVVFYAFNTKLGPIPPIGKFLSPSQGIWQNDKDESITGNIEIEGLSEDVTIKYDEQLIPHIFAKNDIDLYKAQGYITAKHRLWQMEFQTFAAAGRLSEIIGEKALNYDRTQRRKGMVYGAEKSLEVVKTDEESLAYLQAYSDGVNAFINELDPKDYPVEYKLLDYKPEAWSIEKTMHLLMYMTDMLCGGDSDLEYTNVLRKLGQERFDLLFPDFFDINDPIIPKETDWSFVDTEMSEIPQSELPLDSIAETMEKPHPNNGSNNWAISGSKSYSGNPMLASDPHLGLNLPSIWFVMQLSSPTQNTYGATLPGALGIIIGFNNHISWAVTNATRDVKDWYKIEFKDATRQAYKYNNQWKDTEVRIEEIKIRNKETFLDSVIYTHHGPVSYDHTFKSANEKKGYAMKWAGHIGHNFTRLFYKLNNGENYDDYLNAISSHVAPAQNFAFASNDGDIAIWVQGQFPNKWKNQGKFLMDGSNPKHDWQGFIPQEFNAHIKNPDRGFVSSANQHPVDASYPFYVFNDGYEIYRNRVINDFLESKEKISIQDFKDLQNNNFNLKASELLPHMIEHLNTSQLTPEELEILNTIKSWNFYSETDQIAPSIWDAWWTKLYPLVWDEFNVDSVALETPFTYQTINMLKNNPNDSFMDIVETPEKETANDLFLITFKEAVKELTDWKAEYGNYNWQGYKGTFVGHLLQALPAFSRLDLPIGGDRNTVNAADVNHGPSWRMIVEMSSPPKAIGIYPGGQSGNPGSKYYDNFIDKWAIGEYFDILFMQNQNNNNGIIATQTLKSK
ncbi:penicillin acylase family protein [Flavivirga spongiicola]|uniref:Penicillin acylase family protein n=1 Tax=Flavivirga spongiicola TaxID=421621 RepID=A0ABU7XV19_9FLAO|nr:penicillin acylase family protein [Flavivirga sp. MEBiC05379]MDO5978765.1 penicillin acylase family protein [Flavivirga sp. MEBiC05379]